MMNENLRTMLKKLRLSGLSQTLDVRLQEARTNSLDHEEFLELALQDEMNLRRDHLLARRLKSASFPALKTIDQFNWDFNQSINRKLVFNLASCDFIRNAKDILFVGPPGTGKTHLSLAIGMQALKMDFIVFYRSIFDLVRDFMKEDSSGSNDNILKKYLNPDLLIIDDMGIKQLPKQSGEYLFEVIMRRHELKSTIMTSNRPIEEWGKLLADVPAAGAILDRFLHRAEIINITGRSYRLKDKIAE